MFYTLIKHGFLTNQGKRGILSIKHYKQYLVFWKLYYQNIKSWTK